MLASISPLGERARNNRWGVTVLAFTAGSVTTGAALGTILGMWGVLLLGDGRWRLLALATVAAVCGVADLVAPGLVPTVRRQVDENWLVRYRGWVYGVGFGAQLGLGVVTVVTTATIYAWLAAAGLSGSPVAGAVVGATFGAARAVPLLAVAGGDSPDRLRASMRRLAGWAAAGRVAAAGASVALGAGWLAAATWGRS